MCGCGGLGFQARLKKKSDVFSPQLRPILQETKTFQWRWEGGLSFCSVYVCVCVCVCVGGGKLIHIEKQPIARYLPGGGGGRACLPLWNCS